jgi:hypothetical protein
MFTGSQCYSLGSKYMCEEYSKGDLTNKRTYFNRTKSVMGRFMYGLLYMRLRKPAVSAELV